MLRRGHLLAGVMAFAALVGSTMGLATGSSAASAATGSSAASVTPKPTSANSPTYITVTGSPLSGMGFVKGPVIDPVFKPSDTDYIIHHTSSDLNLQLNAVKGGSITSGSASGHSIVVSRPLAVNHALVVIAPAPTGSGTVRYWIRALPTDFPVLTVTGPGSPNPGYYLVEGSGGGSTGIYAMILNQYGTPVWYQKDPAQAANLEVLNGSPDTLAFSANPDEYEAVDGYSIESLDTGTMTQITSPIPPTNLHELYQAPNGNYWMMSWPLEKHVNLSALGEGTNKDALDCDIQEVSPKGQLLWNWVMSQHVAPSESTSLGYANEYGVEAADLYHCNSIDIDPVNGNVLVSSRNTDAVYDISIATHKVLWKLGGVPHNLDGAEILSIKGDGEGAFLRQHDARFEPGMVNGKMVADGDVSLFDDHSSYTGQPADTNVSGHNYSRAVEYNINLAAKTATVDWAFVSPIKWQTPATGSFRRYDGGTDNLIDWGLDAPVWFQEVSNTGKEYLSVTGSGGNWGYRTVKVPLSSLSLATLRATAGLPLPTPPPVPSVTGVSPDSGVLSGGQKVTITGSGFNGATTVDFSYTGATFVVNSNSSITATVPPGIHTGSVYVSVTTGGGRSVNNNKELYTYTS